MPKSRAGRGITNLATIAVIGADRARELAIMPGALVLMKPRFVIISACKQRHRAHFLARLGRARGISHKPTGASRTIWAARLRRR